jgi:uncharacterized protein (DUF1015 family)
MKKSQGSLFFSPASLPLLQYIPEQRRGCMALVFPFRGFRYNPVVVGDISRVVTQPYDRTTPAMQDSYYQHSCYNVVRITLNLEKMKDPDTSYPGAGSTFRKWIEQEVLIQDDVPAFYPYYQEYVIEGQTRTQKGFIALLDLNNSGPGVLPHEHTLAAPKRDRLQLMRSIEGNEDLIYMLYTDDELSINRLMDRSIAGSSPLINVTDEYGTIHRIWTITDPEDVKEIRRGMHSKKLFIADGHHRFETSINFMNECKGKGWNPEGPESFDKRMVACFNLAAGVTILPTHRLVRDLQSFDFRSFLKNISREFSTEPLTSAENLWEKMKADREDHVLGFYPAHIGKFFLLRLKQPAGERPPLPESEKAYRELDVSILHSLLLERYLGIDENKLAAQSHVDYASDREFCIRMVNEGKYQAAFFLNPTTAEQMQRIASLGKRMPQKSTDFYPKLLTGLVFMKMHIRRE